MPRNALNPSIAVAREALVSAAASASVAAVLVWLGPPGADLAAHEYQRALFLQHGFALWNNFWYAGRYSFVTYSLLYYPLAALLGIRLLAVATIGTATLVFAIVLAREWGAAARWSSRTFAVVWAGIVVSAAFPFALGVALALLALWALQGHAYRRFALLGALTVAASPLAFLLLALILAGIAIAHRAEWRRFAAPAASLGAIGGAELLLWRLFPDGGRYPFSPEEFFAACTFCGLGAMLTWRVRQARALSFIFLVYLAACTAAYLLPSAVGENVARLRFLAIPIAVLALSLRQWRPRAVALAALALAAAWNLSPLAASFLRASADPSVRAAYWQPVIRYLIAHREASYRVEVVATASHWEAAYLPEAGIPLARGWFRQDDFPQNRVLYTTVDRRLYLHWLRSLGVRYVVLTTAPLDYSAQAEASLVREGRSGLRRVFSTRTATIFSVPASRPLVDGPGVSRVLSFEQARIVLTVSRPGRYRLAVRYSPYWHSSSACLGEGQDGMLLLRMRRRGVATLAFRVGLGRALGELEGNAPPSCA